MGLANRIAYKFATTMYTTFEQSDNLTKTKHVGAITKVNQTISSSDDNTEIKTIKEYF